MKRNRALALALCIVMCLSLLAGCGSGNGGATPSPSPTQAAGGETPAPGTAEPSPDVEYVEDLVILGGDKIPVIDTSNVAFNVAQSGWICNMVFNNLIKFTVDGDYVPALATEWESDDMQNFTFKLRDDVYFHNGEKFTAADVAYTIDTRGAATGTNAADKLAQIESYEIVSDYEIKMTLAGVNVDFYSDISTPSACIVNEEACEADPEKGPWIGTGAWTVTELVSNEYVLLTRNDDYWGEVPVTKTITIKFVQEISVRLIMLENGEAHAVFGIDPTDYPTIEEDPRFEALSYTMNNTAYVGFNQNDPLMADINFRMAVAHAINRDDCVTITRNGYAEPVTSGTYWGYKTEFKDESIPIIPYDLDTAREYLEKSSYNGEEIEIVAAMADPIKNAQVIQANLQAVGINAVVFETDSPGLSSYAPWGGTDAQMIVGSVAWSMVASAVRTVLYPGSASNRINYNNQEVADLLDEALVTVDVAKREALYKQVQAIVAEDIPLLGIFNMNFIIGCPVGIGGINLYSNNNHDFTYMYMVKQ